ncbi:unnamed protein product, partial [Ascophyllum nodosum]
MSNWEQALSDDQVRYAALDAYASVLLYLLLFHHETRGSSIDVFSSGGARPSPWD